MNTSDPPKDTGTRRDQRPLASGVTALIGLAAFFLPFLSVKGCKSEEIEELRGYEIIVREDGWPYWIAIGIALAVFAVGLLRFREEAEARGFGGAGTALLAGIAGAIVIAYPSLQFLFDTVESRVGHTIASLSWVAVFFISASGAVSAFLAIRNADLPGRPVPILPKRWFIAVWLPAVVSLGVPLLALLDDDKPEAFVRAAALLLFIVAPYLSTLYFLARGIANDKRWAKVWLVAVNLATAAFATWICVRLAS